MNLQVTCLGLATLALCIAASSARYGNHVPKFFAQDSAIIVDTDKLQMAQRLAQPRFHLLPAYPRYDIVQPSTSTPTTTTTTNTPLTSASNDIVTSADVSAAVLNEFPRDLLEIAQQKLGLKRLDEIPSISELGKLLGTSSEAETLRYIRHLTNTEQGIALMKAYIESTDYTDATSDTEDDRNELANDKLSDDEQADDANDGEGDNDAEDDNDEEAEETAADIAADGVDDEDELAELKAMIVMRQDSTKTTTPPPVTSTIMTTMAPNAGFFERMFKYMNIYSLWPSAPRIEVKAMPLPPTTTTQPPAPPAQPKRVGLLRTLLQREPVPFHYPIPMKPLLLPFPPSQQSELQQQTDAITRAPLSVGTAPFNTPKFNLSPQNYNLIKSAISPHFSPKWIDILVQHNPKLAQLATRINNFPLNLNRGSQIEKQLVSAVQKALEQDEDLKKLLHSTDTLK